MFKIKKASAHLLLLQMIALFTHTFASRDSCTRKAVQKSSNTFKVKYTNVNLQYSQVLSSMKKVNVSSGSAENNQTSSSSGIHSYPNPTHTSTDSTYTLNQTLSPGLPYNQCMSIIKPESSSTKTSTLSISPLSFTSSSMSSSSSSSLSSSSSTQTISHSSKTKTNITLTPTASDTVIKLFDEIDSRFIKKVYIENKYCIRNIKKISTKCKVIWFGIVQEHKCLNCLQRYILLSPSKVSFVFQWIDSRETKNVFYSKTLSGILNETGITMYTGRFLLFVNLSNTLIEKNTQGISIYDLLFFNMQRYISLYFLFCSNYLQNVNYNEMQYSILLHKNTKHYGIVSMIYPVIKTLHALIPHALFSDLIDIKLDLFIVKNVLSFSSFPPKAYLLFFIYPVNAIFSFEIWQAMKLGDIRRTNLKSLFITDIPIIISTNLPSSTHMHPIHSIYPFRFQESNYIRDMFLQFYLNHHDLFSISYPLISDAKFYFTLISSNGCRSLSRCIALHPFNLCTCFTIFSYTCSTIDLLNLLTTASLFSLNTYNLTIFLPKSFDIYSCHAFFYSNPFSFINFAGKSIFEFIAKYRENRIITKCYIPKRIITAAINNNRGGQEGGVIDGYPWDPISITLIGVSGNAEDSNIRENMALCIQELCMIFYVQGYFMCPLNTKKITILNGAEKHEVSAAETEGTPLTVSFEDTEQVLYFKRFFYVVENSSR